MAIGEHLDAPDAAQARGREPFTPDDAVPELIDGVRAAGRVTAVLTNGTDGAPAEFASFDLRNRVAAVFSSNEIGFTKPGPRAFRYVLDAQAANRRSSPRNERGTQESAEPVGSAPSSAGTKAWSHAGA